MRPMAFATTPQQQYVYQLGHMDEQDAKKLERKRARNRAAASKCRQKKLAKIGELEVLVNDARAFGKECDVELKALKDMLAQLEQQVRVHQSQGCNIRP